ncbi:uncharacterized protein Z519_01322 [Cladophialophora bantiana CBS 173.52]|uniref:Uncharacterized protein n=1 Tax=Cladophialophora bantiana (strain ATCC 10958 / CBS 173.52 / CDC B-1940 / NIH 8579) TaxID=1442370 RepID=A0A0D2HWJ1_CLAB1|nr:uncharacterized protein Z519_01322 [Cladophialophora bantiana CBS 173.52]KIW97738.1 hypothetical protein Z519_01322 [Cladophialophora bantiana CBS 173.52]
MVERHIHKVEQRAAKDAQKNSRSTKKWWQFGMGEKPTEKTALTDSCGPKRSEGSSWWPSLSKTGHDPKSPKMIQQKKEVHDSSSDEETV